MSSLISVNDQAAECVRTLNGSAAGQKAMFWLAMGGKALGELSSFERSAIMSLLAGLADPAKCVGEIYRDEIDANSSHNNIAWYDLEVIEAAERAVMGAKGRR